MSVKETVSPIPPTSIEVVQDIGVLEGDFLWRAPETEVDLVAGLRYFDLTAELRPSMLQPRKSSVSLLDPVVGVQWGPQLSERWKLNLRGDLGGFGVGSRLTYQAFALLGWKATRNLRIAGGYRVLGYDLDRSDVRLQDLTFSGMMLGLAWAW
jgi:hypothetical protein